MKSSVLFSLIGIFSAASVAANEFEFDDYLVPYEKLTAEQKEEVETGGSARFTVHYGEMEGAQAYAVLNVSMETVWEGLIDYENLDKWLHGVKKITNVVWHNDVTAQAVYTVNSPFKDVSYTLKRTHLQPDVIRWTRIAGDLETIYGGYNLYPYDGGKKTLMSYVSFVEFGFWVPERIKRYFTIKGLGKLMASMQKRFNGDWEWPVED